MNKSTAAQRASLQKKKAEKHISQLENQQKILLNRLRKEERNARTSRLCNHGAILEGVFPAAVTTDCEEIKAFLIALSRLPGACCDGGCAPIPCPILSKGGNIHRNISLPCQNHPAEQGQVRCGRCRLSER